MDLSTWQSGGVTRVCGIGGVDSRRRLWVTLAGPAADHEFILGVTHWNRIDDVLEADDLCRQLQVSPDRIFSRLQELLRANRAAVDALANELDEKHHLERDQVEAILSKHLEHGAWLCEVRLVGGP
ncbi:MAG TPA: hypothetical protein VGQ29_08525 [Gemmatimonadales bacterium]|nr:hypothetical protein [Gemmatimonadales bacterium]